MRYRYSPFSWFEVSLTGALLADRWSLVCNDSVPFIVFAKALCSELDAQVKSAYWGLEQLNVCMIQV